MDPRLRGDDKKKIEERQIDFVLDFCFKSRKVKRDGNAYGIWMFVGRWDD